MSSLLRYKADGLIISTPPAPRIFAIRGGPIISFSAGHLHHADLPHMLTTVPCWCRRPVWSHKSTVSMEACI
jgi:hypothetical protein